MHTTMHHWDHAQTVCARCGLCHVPGINIVQLISELLSLSTIDPPDLGDPDDPGPTALPLLSSPLLAVMALLPDGTTYRPSPPLAHTTAGCSLMLAVIMMPPPHCSPFPGSATMCSYWRRCTGLGGGNIREDVRGCREDLGHEWHRLFHGPLLAFISCPQSLVLVTAAHQVGGNHI